MHYHLIGIAGTAMASLAGLLRAKGHEVTGSDEGVYPPMSDMLRELGIEYAQPFSPVNLEPTPDVVVVGNAIGRGNPELEAVLDVGLRYTSAAETIKDQFLWGRHVLAVAGTHGKTTTTSILAWILECAGLNPSFLIGGVAENFGTSFRLSDSDFFVIEADEYDTAFFDKTPKMWHYIPKTAVVTNVEFDHADIYRDDIAYRFAFERFVNIVPGTGSLVLGWEGDVERSMARSSRAQLETFGVGDEHGSVTHPQWVARDIEHGPDGSSFTLLHAGLEIGRFATPLSGDFNVRNCLAAIVAARSVDASWEGIREALEVFRTVRRRMEVRGEVGGVTVIDDFAHHPTAVRETILAARQRYPDRRLVAVFEPRSYTAQRREFQDDFRKALSGADRVVVAGLFRPERYDEKTGMNPAQVAAELRQADVQADYIPEVDDIVSAVVDDAREGDVVLVMSNGGFGGIHGKLLWRLEGV